MTRPPKIVISRLVKRFKREPVLDGVDLVIEERESIAIIGQSGVGKSVLIKCMLGLIEPDSGSIRIAGQEMVGASEKERAAVRARCGMLFQGAALFDSLPVWQNVTFGLTQGRTRHAARMRAVAEETLERVGLGREVLNLRPSELSGGMQKRVALARAIAPRPEILFFDEPTTGLDPIRADSINDLIVSMVDEAGITALTITHDMRGVRKVAHRVAMLHQGRIVWNGPKDELDRSGNPYVDQFVQGRAEGPIR